MLKVDLRKVIRFLGSWLCHESNKAWLCDIRGSMKLKPNISQTNLPVQRESVLLTE